MENKQPIALSKIDPTDLYKIISDQYTGTVRENWKLIQSTLTSSDIEDGGGWYDLILQHIPTNRFYLTSYCDWDIENTDFKNGKVVDGGRCDLDCILYEVEPRQVTTTVYKRI